MPLHGAVTLGDIERQSGMLAVACSRCERSGRCRIARLIARHARDMKLPDLGPILAADCPRMQSVSIYDRCGVCFPTLPMVSQP